MPHPFEATHYTIRRKVLKILGASFHIYGENGELLGFSSQKAFRLKEDIRIFRDEAKAHPLLRIQARQVIDFSAAYDIVDEETGAKVGAARRKGFKSILRDSWEILDEHDQVLGSIQEDSMMMATLRRFLTNLIPQNFVLGQGPGQVHFKQRFNPFVYRLVVDVPDACPIDRRLILGTAALLAAVEGRQG